MVYPERRDANMAHIPSPSPSTPDIPSGRAEYKLGGPIGQMQADLARRLAREGIIRRPEHVLLGERPGERTVRWVSIAGGGLALLMAYAGVVIMILR